MRTDVRTARIVRHQSVAFGSSRAAQRVMLAALLGLAAATPALATGRHAPPDAGTRVSAGEHPEVSVAVPASAPPSAVPWMVSTGEAVAGNTLPTDAVPWASLVGPPALGGAMVQGAGGGPAIEYYALDALGSVRVVFDAAGAVKARADYEPFGAAVTSSTTGPLPREQFTGQQRDSEVKLDYFGARFYHSAHGRMLSVDPLYVGAVGDPQRWNRYAYALNSPVVMSDPDGRTPNPSLCTPQVQAINSSDYHCNGYPQSPGQSPLLNNSSTDYFQLGYGDFSYQGSPGQTVSHPKTEGSPGGAADQDATQEQAEQEADFSVTIEWFIDETLPFVSDGAAGFGDTLTFGGTSWLRNRGGFDAVRYDSWSYLGGEIGGYAWQGLAGTALLNKTGAFARGGGWLNSNDYLRLGWSWKGSAKAGSDVFRIGVGSKRTVAFGKKIHGHVTLWPPRAW